jgi:translation initiation factor 3 subunit G
MAPPQRTWADDDDSSASENEAELVRTTGDDGDALGGEVQPKIPPTHTSRVDAKGIKTVTSYKASPNNPSQLVKTVARIKVTTAMVREHVNVQKRRKWKKFGQAALEEDTSNVTILSRDDIKMEDPNEDVDQQDDDPTKAISQNLNAFWAKQQRRQLERKYDVDDTDVEAVQGGGLSAADKDAGWKTAGPSKYVPPSQRGAGGGGGGKSLADMAAAAGSGAEGGMDAGGKRFGQDRDQNTIRVTNISEDTTEVDLQELFQGFGRISRVYLAKDKETMISRGFAFVSFVHREDAQKAMDKLQGFGYDHLILKLEWAKPSAPKDPAAASTFRSGYGKALAQDTTEKVSYASNLTR